MASLLETEVEEDQGDDGLTILYNGQDYPLQIVGVIVGDFRYQT